MHRAPLLLALVLLASSAQAAQATGYEPHWYFESLSGDGKRALLRELDPEKRARFHVRVVQVDSGEVDVDTTLPELAKVPAATIGALHEVGRATGIAELQWMLASPAFARDIARGAAIAEAFPFGACGRLAATHLAPGHGARERSAIAFDAGDWLYVADANGRVQKRMSEEAAYDPRFSPDGKSLFFRRATGSDGLFAKYELFVAPADQSAPPRALPGTAGLRDRFFPSPDGAAAVAFSSKPRFDRSFETCAISVGLRPPFATRRLACMDGGEQLVEAVVSPKGAFAAVSTKKHGEHGPSFRLRVVALTTGKILRDEPESPGLEVRAISDGGILVQSGVKGVLVTDVPARDDGEPRFLDAPLELGHRGFFRSDHELVYLDGGRARVLDVLARTSQHARIAP